MSDAYSLLCDGKVIAVEHGFKAACDRAKIESLVVGGVTYKGKEGRIVSVWSGSIVKSRGITKHASYACGERF